MKAYEKIILVIMAGLIAWSSWLMTSLNAASDLNKKLTTDLNEQVDINTQQQTRIQQLAELDKTHTQELAHAKSEIDALRGDVAAGRRRLRIAATCPKSEATATPGVDDAARPRLEDSVVRDYFTLTERVTTMQAQLEGLQDYVRTQCQ
ncbi:lysis protein [Photorhabdus hindustanensis]|uniref:Lysis protein n=1 Tax=Photorhabdus hindustanensis TaxID=2918802 RepID=A0A2S8PU32_9GAMM|nr:lysis protein [Photorhabdus hindustanensis]PQQ22269.1 lysis protein [Photorhabdus hindustanensis]